MKKSTVMVPESGSALVNGILLSRMSEDGYNPGQACNTHTFTRPTDDETKRSVAVLDQEFESMTYPCIQLSNTESRR
jgi:hypothetical protein